MMQKSLLRQLSDDLLEWDEKLQDLRVGDRAKPYLELYFAVRVLHRQLYEILQADKPKALEIPLNDIPDIVFCIRKIKLFSEEVRKDLEFFSEILQKIGCLIWVENKMMTGDTEHNPPIRGAIANGSPTVRTCAKIPKMPKRGEPLTDDWVALMTFLKIPPPVQKLRLVKVNWKPFQELIQNITEAGKPLPPGIDPSKTFDRCVINVSIQKRVDIDMPETYRKDSPAEQPELESSDNE